MNRSLLSPFLAAIVCGGLCAQPGDEPEVNVSFTVLGWERSDENFSFQSGQSVQSFTLPVDYRSDEMRYTGSNPLVFFKEEAGPDGSATRVPLATIELDPSLEKQLLLFMEAPEGSEAPFRVIAMDDSLKSFPQRSYRFFNLADERVGVALNEHRVILENLKESVIYLNTDEAMIQMGVYAERDGSYKDVLNLRWPHRGNERYLVFIVDSPYTEGSLATKAIPEYF